MQYSSFCLKVAHIPFNHQFKQNNASKKEILVITADIITAYQ